jgi:hypothetical protein
MKHLLLENPAALMSPETQFRKLPGHHSIVLHWKKSMDHNVSSIWTLASQNFFPLWCWGINQGLHACLENTLPLDPCPQPFCISLLRQGLSNFAQASFQITIQLPPPPKVAEITGVYHQTWLHQTTLRSHPSRLLTVKQMGSYSYQLT